MEPFDFLCFIGERLDRLGINYLTTGSMATIFYGEPRLTIDVDIVVELKMEDVEPLCREFPDDEFYTTAAMAEDAVRRKGQFNIIHPSSGLKADVIVSKQTEFDTSRFARRQREFPEQGYPVWFASPEDVILKKLVYYQDGESDKHIRDILGVLRIQSDDAIDFAYLDRWSKTLNVDELWHDVLSRHRSD